MNFFNFRINCNLEDRRVIKVVFDTSHLEKRKQIRNLDFVNSRFAQRQTIILKVHRSFDTNLRIMLNLVDAVIDLRNSHLT